MLQTEPKFEAVLAAGLFRTEGVAWNLDDVPARLEDLQRFNDVVRQAAEVLYQYAIDAAFRPDLMELRQLLEGRLTSLKNLRARDIDSIEQPHPGLLPRVRSLEVQSISVLSEACEWLRLLTGDWMRFTSGSETQTPSAMPVLAESMPSGARELTGRTVGVRLGADGGWLAFETDSELIAIPETQARIRAALRGPNVVRTILLVTGPSARVLREAAPGHPWPTPTRDEAVNFVLKRWDAVLRELAK